MTELSPEAKKLMRIAREEYSPADQRVTAVRSALDARIALGTGDGGAGGAGPAAAGALNLARLLGFGALAVAIAGATVIGMRSATPPAATSTAMHAPALPTPSSIAAPELAAHEEPTALPAVPRDEPRGSGAMPAPTNDRKTESAAPVAQVAPVVAPHAAIAVAPRAPRVRHAATATERPREHARRSRADVCAAFVRLARRAGQRRSGAGRVPRGRSRPDAGRPEPNKIVNDSLAREIALLKRARAALDRNDARAALAATDDYARSSRAVSCARSVSPRACSRCARCTAAPTPSTPSTSSSASRRARRI